MSWISLGSKTITLPVAGIIKVDGAAQQSTNTTAAGQATRWNFNLLIDGQLVWNPGGAGPLDCVALGGCLYCDAGPRTVELRWMADPTVKVTKAYLTISGLNNTVGV